MSANSPEGLVSATELTAQVTEGRFKRVLGTPSLVLFGLVYMVPLTVFTTYGIVTELTGGRLVDAYLITLVVMIFTARSYARMSAAYPYSGSAYIYTQQSFGGAVGFLVGWALLLDYLFLPMINYLVVGLYVNQYFPSIPQWIVIVVAIVLVTVLNVIGITSVARANYVIIAVQAIFVVIFVAMAFAAAAGKHVDPLLPLTGGGSDFNLGNLCNGAAILALSFLGFDAVSTLSEEAKDPRRHVPRAIMIVTLAAGVIFVVLSWAAQAAYPAHTFGKNTDTASTIVVNSVGGQFLSILFVAGFVAGALGSALTSQASVARIVFAMGRDGVLPRRVFGHLNVRFGTPFVAIVIIGVVSLAAIWIDLATLSNMISFGALIAFSFVNLSVIMHYFVREKERSGGSLINNLVLPAVGFALTGWLWTSLSGVTFLIGGAWLAVGVVILLIVTRFFTRPTPMLDLKE